MTTLPHRTKSSFPDRFALRPLGGGKTLPPRFKSLAHIREWAGQHEAEILKRGGRPFLRCGRLVLEVVEVRP